MAITQAPKSGKLTHQQAPCTLLPPWMERICLLRLWTIARLPQSLQTRVQHPPCMCIEPLFQGLDLRHQGDNAKHSLVLTPSLNRI